MTRERVARLSMTLFVLLASAITIVTQPAQTVQAASGGAWTLTGNMKESRLNHTATLLASGVNAGRVLVAGGTPPSSTLPITQPDELYNPATGTWSYTTTGMIVPRWAHQAVTLNDGRVLMGGGVVAGGITASVPTQTATAEVYQTDGTWHAVGSMAHARSGFTMFLLADGKVLAIGGYDGIAKRNDAEIFNPQTNTWSANGGLNHARAGHAATLLNTGKVLVTGGGNGGITTGGGGTYGYETISELYDPATGLSRDFAPSQDLSPVGAWGGVLHTQTLLQNGHVLIGLLSATTDDAPTIIFEYDPANLSVPFDFRGAAYQSINSATYRTDHVAVRLADGSVLFAGGTTSVFDHPTLLATTMRIFPASVGESAFARAADMQRARHAFAAIRLPNGTVLAAGGSGDNTSEIYAAPVNPPVATLNVTSIDYGPIPVTTNQSRTVTITNTGEDFLVLSNQTISPPYTSETGGFFGGTEDCGNKVLASGATCSMVVQFLPVAAQSFSATLAFTDNAVGSPHTVALSGSGVHPVPTLSPASVSFGPLSIGSSTTQVVRLTNTSSDPMSVSSVGVSGDIGGLSLSDDQCSGHTVAGSGNCAVTVRFQPPAVQSYTGTLSFTDNGAGSPQTAALTGSGFRPAPTFSPTSVSFGAQAAGTANTRIVVLTNPGAAPLTITTISATPADAFTIGGNTCGQSLAAGGSCGITVRFQPPAGQAYSATLSVFDNATGSPHTVALSGSGSFAGGPAPSFSPASVDFGNTPINDTAVNAYRALKLTNTGSQPLRVDSLTLSGANQTDFRIMDFRCQGKTLARSDYCVIYLQFHPGASGARSTTLNVYSNANADPNAPPTTVALSGTGVVGTAPLLRLREEFTDFGSQSVGTISAAQTVYLQNTGNAPLTLGTISAVFGGSTQNFAVGSECANRQIAPGAQCGVSVFFQPTAAGIRMASFNVGNDAAGGPQPLYFAGTGIAASGPAVTFNVASLDFGAQAVNTTSNAATVTMTNSGTAPLAISSITATGDFAAPGNTCGASLAAGASCAITVRFTPTASGGRGGSLLVADNASGSPHFISLTGSGGTAAGTPQWDLNAFRGADLHDIPVGSTQIVSATVHNLSATTPLTIISCTFTDDYMVQSGCGSTLAAGEYNFIYYQARPTQTGTRSGTLTVVTNAPGSPHTATFTMNGTGAPLAGLPATLDVGNQPVSTTGAPNAVTVQNTGNLPLTVSGVTAGGEFAQANDCVGSPLAASATCTISVRFTPTQLGARTGTLTVTTDDAGGAHTVALSGTGTAPPPKVVRLSTLSVPVAGGTQVTITGTGFQPGDIVFFGDTAGTIVGTPTATTIVATTPAHAAGTVDVTVANPDGQYSDVYTGFSFVPPGGVGLPPGQPGGPGGGPTPAPVPGAPRPPGAPTGPTPAPIPISR